MTQIPGNHSSHTTATDSWEISLTSTPVTKDNVEMLHFHSAVEQRTNVTFPAPLDQNSKDGLRGS